VQPKGLIRILGEVTFRLQLSVTE